MIKAFSKMADGRLLVMLGLSRQNTELLLDDKPIVIDLQALGYAGAPRIVLCAGETEADLERDFEPFIGPETKVHR